MQWRKIILFFLRKEGKRRVERQVKQKNTGDMSAERFAEMSRVSHT